MKTSNENIGKNDDSQNPCQEDENYSAISNLLKVGDSFSQLLMLFDIMVETDSVKLLCLEDAGRVNTVCNHYGIELSNAEKELLIDNLKKLKQARRRKIVLNEEYLKERDSFISELEKAFGG